MYVIALTHLKYSIDALEFSSKILIHMWYSELNQGSFFVMFAGFASVVLGLYFENVSVVRI